MPHRAPHIFALYAYLSSALPSSGFKLYPRILLYFSVFLSFSRIGLRTSGQRPQIQIVTSRPEPLGAPTYNPSNPLPQDPNLRNLGPALREQMMARLPLPAVALSAPVRIQTLWAGHPFVKGETDRRVACEQLVIPLGRELAGPPECSLFESGAARGEVP